MGGPVQELLVYDLILRAVTTGAPLLISLQFAVAALLKVDLHTLVYFPPSGDRAFQPLIRGKTLFIGELIPLYDVVGFVISCFSFEKRR